MQVNKKDKQDWIDDIIIPVLTFKEQLESLCEIFDCLRQGKLSTILSKPGFISRCSNS